MTLNIISSSVASDPIFRAGELVRPLRIRRHPRARSMRLAVDARDGSVWLTLPPRASTARGEAWAEEKRHWIEAALARIPSRRALEPDGEVRIDDHPRRIDWKADRARRVLLFDDRVDVGGSRDGVERRILDWLRRHALETLHEESWRMAEAASIAIGVIRVGDPHSRWASCSSTGNLRYSWRLIMAPPEVRRAVVAHELAHRLHMDHSPAFHRAVATLFGRVPVAERRWLAEHGQSLHQVGRSA